MPNPASPAQAALTREAEAVLRLRQALAPTEAGRFLLHNICEVLAAEIEGRFLKLNKFRLYLRPSLNQGSSLLTDVCLVSASLKIVPKI